MIITRLVKATNSLVAPRTGEHIPTQTGKRIIHSNYSFKPSLPTRFFDLTRLGFLPRAITNIGLVIGSRVSNPRIANLTGYIRDIHKNGDIGRLKYHWDIVKRANRFTRELYKGLAEGRKDFFEGHDDFEAVVSRFRHQLRKDEYSSQDLKLFLTSVTNFITASIEQLYRNYPWGLTNTLARHMELGERHAVRNIFDRFVPEIRQATRIVIEEQVKKEGGDWKDGYDEKMWEVLFDRVWDSMTLEIPSLHLQEANRTSL